MILAACFSETDARDATTRFGYNNRGPAEIADNWAGWAVRAMS